MIKNLGFKKCPFHWMVYDLNLNKSVMLLDDFELKKEYIGGKFTTKSVKKSHPKWNSFYKLDFTKTLSIWVCVEKQTIQRIWIDGDSIKHVVYI